MIEDHEPIEFSGLEAAVIGVASQQDGTNLLVYNVQKILEILERDMPREDAQEFFEFHIRGLYAGPGTPLLMDAMNHKQALEMLAGAG